MGEWFRGYKHGKGVMKYRNGEQYEGGFYHGYFYGEGKFTWNDGGWYEVKCRYWCFNLVT